MLIWLLLIFLATDAEAYVDPGTGSMLLQVVLGGIAAVGVILKLYWHKFLRLFKRNEPVKKEDQ